jgi:ADP-ribose pyrophosphatase YjhB (NUDIX family)
MVDTHNLFTVGIGIILENIKAKKILLLKRNPSKYEDNKWDIVGGRLNHGESLHKCLKREILEETGISDLTIIKV